MPVTATMNPSVAARLYAGAVEATAMRRFEMYPSASALRPLAPGALVSRAPGSEVVAVLSKVMRNLCGPPRGGKEQVDHKVSPLWTKRPKAPPVRCDAMAEAQMSVAVLGAAGTIAPAIVHDLGVSDGGPSMVPLDLDPDKAAAVADEHGHGKATAARVDARDVDAPAGAIAGAGVLLNTASYRINLDAMRACLRAGCDYLDLGGLYHVTGEQLALGP